MRRNQHAEVAWAHHQAPGRDRAMAGGAVSAADGEGAKAPSGNADSRAFTSRVPRSAATCTSAFEARLLGRTWRFSQRLTVENVTRSACARACCLRPVLGRHKRIMWVTFVGGTVFRDAASPWCGLLTR